MRNQRWLLFVILLASLALLLVACGGGDDTGTAPEATQAVQAATDTLPPPPTDTPIPPTNTPPPPTETPTGSTEPGGEGEGLDSVIRPTELDSFRSSMTLSWQGTMTDGTEIAESMTVLVEYVREPLAEHVTMSGDFPGMEDMGIESGQALEMYVVEGTMYMNLFGSWLQMPAEEAGLDADEMAFSATEDMLGELEKANYEGQTTYNGVKVKHYTFDEKSFDLADLPAGAEIDEASGNVYVAVEGDYVVHMDMTMSGDNVEVPSGQGETLQNGSLTITMDLTDINQPITIELPPEALESGKPPEDIPVPENAEDLQALGMMGMLTYQSASTPEELVDFYKAEMPKNGWTEVSVDVTTGMANLEYSKEDRTATIMITPDSDTGKTAVMIAVQE